MDRHGSKTGEYGYASDFTGECILYAYPLLSLSDLFLSRLFLHFLFFPGADLLKMNLAFTGLKSMLIRYENDPLILSGAYA